MLAFVASLSLAQESCAPQSSSDDFVGQCLNQYPPCMESSHEYKAQSPVSEHFSQYDNASVNHLGQTSNCPNLANDAARQLPDPHNLPSGYYDALDNPISEEEYLCQVDYEQKHGIPWARDRVREKADTKKPLSLLAHPEMGCSGDFVARIIKSGNCYGNVQGVSIFVNHLPSDCEVVTFKDAACKDDPFDVIPALSYASGCYTTDAFSSVRVDCQPLPV